MTISPRRTTSGIKPGLVKPYDFEDQGFARPGDPRHSPKFCYFAHLACAVAEAFYVKSRKGQWERVTNKSHAITRVYQEHGGVVTIAGVQVAVTRDDVAAFFGGGIVHFTGTTYAQLMGDFVWFNSERRLNLYRDGRISGDEDDIISTEEFLKVLRNSLCNEPDEIDLDAMLAEIASDRPTPFRWMIHYLAAKYQLPGYSTQTNLWFVGGRGTGKGSLMSVLRAVFGAKAIGKVDASDIARGWTTSLGYADIVEWDEFRSTGWHDLNRLIKEKTGNETFAVTQRNVGDTLHPFVAGQIMSTNDKRAMAVEGDDRQNTFVQTTHDQAWKDRAKALWNVETNELIDPRIPSGFAALLNSVNIDYAFIRKPLRTDLKDDLIDFFADDGVEQWLEEVKSGGGLTHEHPSWEDLHSSYRAYVRDHLSTKPKDLKEFRKELQDKGLAQSVSRKGPLRDGKRPSFRFVQLTGENVVEIGEAA